MHDSQTVKRVLTGQRATTEQVSLSVVHQVSGQPPPQQKQYSRVPVILCDTRTAQLDRIAQHFRQQRRQFKLYVRIEPSSGSSHFTGLHAIGSDDPVLILGVHHNQVVALFVEFVHVAACEERSLKPFAKLEIKDLEPELQRGEEFFFCAREPCDVPSLSDLPIRDQSAESRGTLDLLRV